MVNAVRLPQRNIANYFLPKGTECAYYLIYFS